MDHRLARLRLRPTDVSRGEFVAFGRRSRFRNGTARVSERRSLEDIQQHTLWPRLQNLTHSHQILQASSLAWLTAICQPDAERPAHLRDRRTRADPRPARWIVST